MTTGADLYLSLPMGFGSDNGSRSVTVLPRGFGSNNGGQTCHYRWDLVVITVADLSLPRGFGSDNGGRSVTTKGIW